MSFNNTRTPTKPTAKAKYQLPMRRGKNGSTEYYLTPDLEEKFRKLFPKHSNIRIMTWFGISFATLQRFKRQLGLQKDMTAIRKELARDVKKICEKNGWYDSIRGKALSPQCIEATKKMRASGFHPILRLKEKNPRKYRKLMQQRSENRLALERKERRRVNIGLEQQTRLHRPQFKYTRTQVHHRYSALNKGYILGDMRELSGERYTIYYDKKTARSAKFEHNCELDGFTIQPLP